MTARRLVTTVGRFVLRGLVDLGRCHLMADWAVFTPDPDEHQEKTAAEPRNEGTTDVGYHRMGGFRT